MSGSATGKRKKGEPSQVAKDADTSGSSNPPTKKARVASVAKSKAKEKQKATKAPWPEYFNEVSFTFYCPFRSPEQCFEAF